FNDKATTEIYTLSLHDALPIFDAVFQRSEAGVVAGAKQILDLGFREILILPANVLRHVDVFDLGLKTERAEQRRNQVAKAPGLRSEEHTSELQSQSNIVCRLLL